MITESKEIRSDMIKWIKCEKCIYYVPEKTGNVKYCDWNNSHDIYIPKITCWLFKRKVIKKGKLKNQIPKRLEAI